MGECVSERVGATYPIWAYVDHRTRSCACAKRTCQTHLPKLTCQMADHVIISGTKHVVICRREA